MSVILDYCDVHVLELLVLSCPNTNNITFSNITFLRVYLHSDKFTYFQRFLVMYLSVCRFLKIVIKAIHAENVGTVQIKTFQFEPVVCFKLISLSERRQSPNCLSMPHSAPRNTGFFFVYVVFPSHVPSKVTLI